MGKVDPVGPAPHLKCMWSGHTFIWLLSMDDQWIRCGGGGCDCPDEWHSIVMLFAFFTSRPRISIIYTARGRCLVKTRWMLKSGTDKSIYGEYRSIDHVGDLRIHDHLQLLLCAPLWHSVSILLLLYIIVLSNAAICYDLSESVDRSVWRLIDQRNVMRSLLLAQSTCRVIEL